MRQLDNGFEFISTLKQSFMDRGVLAVTGLLSYLSVSVEELNLYLAIVVKIGAISTTAAYFILNRRRIWVATVSLFKKSTKK